MVDGGLNEEVELNIDWDHLLDSIPDDLNFDFCDPPLPDGFSNSPCSLSINDIEQYLMVDDESNRPEDKNGDVLADGLFSDLLLGSSPADLSKDYTASPESAVEVATDEEDKQKDKPLESDSDVHQTKENTVADDDDNDPLAKKLKRQMRNRDAAVRSRERKKMYVRDLEMKSKYYEAECKRLGIMLQCCIAENQALRLSLHSSKASDASMTKQESAVLLLESLLLGSLLGFMGIIGLLILHTPLLLILEMGLLENEGSGEWENVRPRRAENKVPRVESARL